MIRHDQEYVEPRLGRCGSSPWQGEVGAKRREGVGPRTRRRGSNVRLARYLRREMTKAEMRLWHFLRRKRLLGLKFRRQHPFGPYVLDFYCPELALAIEVDGSQHGKMRGRKHDQERDAYLARHGVMVLRYWTADVLRDVDGVVNDICAKIQLLLNRPTPSLTLPLPGGGKGARMASGRLLSTEGRAGS